jgi:hypothetical protein
VENGKRLLQTLVWFGLCGLQHVLDIMQSVMTINSKIMSIG